MAGFVDEFQLAQRFTTHEISSDEIERCERLRALAYTFAQSVLDLVPESRERSMAINMIDQSVMWANAGIARNGR
jgi:hypothetical protein